MTSALGHREFNALFRGAEERAQAREKGLGDDSSAIRRV